MLYLSENLKKYRILKNLTQEDIASFLGITSQSVSKWERGESYPDITLLPALANIFETSIDLLVGMDTIRAEATRYNIHKKANTFQKKGDYDSAEKIYRDALLIYPNKPGMLLGLASTLALKGDSLEAIELIEKGIPISINEKQKAWITAHIHMFEFFGGVAKILVSNNCTTAVNHQRSDWYTPALNITYHKMAKHYGTDIIPARVRKPKDNPLADAIMVRIVYDAYKINIESIDPSRDLSMREVYGIDKNQAQ